MSMNPRPAVPFQPVQYPEPALPMLKAGDIKNYFVPIIPPPPLNYVVRDHHPVQDVLNVPQPLRDGIHDRQVSLSHQDLGQRGDHGVPAEDIDY